MTELDFKITVRQVEAQSCPMRFPCLFTIYQDSLPITVVCRGIYTETVKAYHGLEAEDELQKSLQD